MWVTWPDEKAHVVWMSLDAASSTSSPEGIPMSPEVVSPAHEPEPHSRTARSEALGIATQTPRSDVCRETGRPDEGA